MMKKILYTTMVLLTVISCKQKPNDFVTFSGRITNKDLDSLIVSNPELKFEKTIKLDQNGTFKDTMKVEKDIYYVYHGKKFTPILLGNGDNITLTLDTKQFNESVKFIGKGGLESNLLSKLLLLERQFLKDKTLFNLPEKEFDAKVDTYINDCKKRVNYKDLDTTYVAFEAAYRKSMKRYLYKEYAKRLYIAKNLTKGTVSPKFVNYENFKGGTTSLDDLKGKYVYIDLWATWCNPCKKEIPFLQKLEKQFHDKEIEFVSISLDKKKNYQDWKNMIEDKELSGIQLYADKNWKSQFVKDYRVSSIPRFILIDKEGYIIDADAPGPSDPELIGLLKGLKF